MEYKVTRFLIIEYNGIKSNTVGNILLLKNNAIIALRPANLYLENAYDANVDAVRETTVVTAATIKLFFMAARKFTVVVNSFV